MNDAELNQRLEFLRRAERPSKNAIPMKSNRHDHD